MENKVTQQMHQPQEPTSVQEALAPELAGLREKRIAERAYGYAQARGFAGDRQLDDWLEAEREIDRAQGNRG
jgi:hypothetical protein